MLGLGTKISPLKIIFSLILPSVFCIILPLVIVLLRTKTQVEKLNSGQTKDTRLSAILFYVGLASLCFIPFFKTLTGLPPFMGMLFSLGVIWIFTEILHRKKNIEHKNQYSVVSAIQRIDVPSILFFLGILLSVSALSHTGVLNKFALFLNTIGSESFVAIVFWSFFCSDR